MTNLTQLKVGVAQIRNGMNLAENLDRVLSSAKSLAEAGVDIVLFPECALTGFSAAVKDMNFDEVELAIQKVRRASELLGIAVLLPSVLKNASGEFQNSGYLMIPENSPQQFFKEGLTASEVKFFTPSETQLRSFQFKEFQIALLICIEAADQPWKYLNSENPPDLILWPGYWGWGESVMWDEREDEEGLGSGLKIRENCDTWQRMMIQANFSENSLGDTRAGGPTGLSVVIDAQNQLDHRGRFKEEDLFLVELTKTPDQMIVSRVSSLT